MDPYLLEEIQRAHDATVVAREALEEVLETINANDVELEESKMLADDAGQDVYLAIDMGRIPINTIDKLEEGALSVFIQNTMNSIAERLVVIVDTIERATHAENKEDVVHELTFAKNTAQQIEQAWADIIPIAEMQIAEGQPVHLSSNASNNEYNNSNESNNESNNEFSGGYKKRTLRKKRHAKRTEKRHAKRRAKRTLRKRSEKRTAKRCKKRHAKHREKRTKKQRYF
jgi:hypothetical protein